MKHRLITLVGLALAGHAAWAAESSSTELATLAKNKNCFACHAVEKKVVGPAFAEVAKVYAKDPKAADTLTEKVLKGGSGKWGPIPMPSNAQVSPAEARKLVEWVLQTAPAS